MAQQDDLKIPADGSASSQITTLEQRVSLSRSLIWRLQRDFYAKRALKAWTEDLVPSYITNNPFIAEIYAQILAGFLEDCFGQDSQNVSREKPMRILELGAGTGKFAYLLLRNLSGLLRMRNIPMDTLRYVMTECSEEMISGWQGNPYLAEFATQGLLEFRVFSAAQDGASSDSWLGKREAGPLVVIANYVFDTLPQDAFALDHGQVNEFQLTTLSSNGSIPDLQDLRLSFDQSRVSSEHYKRSDWNLILEQYRTRLPKATVFFPTATLQTLQGLRESSNGTLLVLAADKGIAHEEELAMLQGEPPMEFHASKRCFSQMVNFDAMAKYFCNRGGEALLPRKHVASLNLCGFLDHAAGQSFHATRNAYLQATEGFGPDDLFALMTWLNDHLEQTPMATAISLLRLTRWDPTALTRLFPAIARQARNATTERNDLRDAVLRTWENHYPLLRDDNILPFYCGVILLELRFFSEAYAMFRKSQQMFAPSAATSYNLGLCCLGMNRRSEALDFMREACTLDVQFEPAQQSRLKLETELSQ
jgi:putative S-adenosyl-L-methionine-dependent methyltransferase